MNEPENKENQAQENKSGFFTRLKSGLAKTRTALAGGINQIALGKAEVGPELLNDLEELLLASDVGFPTTQFILDQLKTEVRESRIREQGEVVGSLKKLMIQILEENQNNISMADQTPFIILVIGVNGSGKTTTIGKLTQRWKDEGKNVLLGAGDTFRAAAAEQLQAWAERVGVACIQQKPGADPSAVAYDTVQAAVARKADIALIDTAGRLQTNLNLMEELKKVKRVIGKVLPGAPHETLLVLDSTIGQNSISQAKMFHEAVDIDGLVMTKLDGTSKGGVLFNITREMKLPVRFIGVGEQVNDLQDFHPREFVEALFSK